MIPAALVLLLIAAAVLWIAQRQRQSTGLPSGRIISDDMRGWKQVEKPLYDPIAGLTGKPDYLVQTAHGLVPVEVKSSRAPSLPHDSHIFQLAAYCLLVERTYGKRPAYGILRYRDRTFSIDYSPALEAELLSLLDAIRAQDRRSEVDRSHEDARRCAGCGYRNLCDQRL